MNARNESPSRDHLRALCEFAGSTRYADLPLGAVETIKFVLLDSLGCAFAADGLDPNCQRLGSIYAPGTQGPCSVFSTGAKTSATDAARVNGALVHALNFDPAGLATGHTGVACVAAPFALGEACGASGTDLLLAAVVAAEVSARITHALVAAGLKPSGDFLSGQLLSHFGAAAGAARIIGLNSAQVESAMGLALMQASGSRQVIFGEGAPAKSIYGAFPAANAVHAALMAQAGIDGRCDILGPPAGLYPAYYRREIDTKAITAGLSDHFMFADLDFKRWPASNHVIPFIEAAIAASSCVSDVSRIEQVTLVAAPHIRPFLEPIASKMAPADIAAAGNSAPWCASVALMVGAFKTSFIDPAKSAQAGVGALSGKILLQYDDAVRGGRLILRQSGETPQVFEVDQPLGHASRPMSESDHLEKFRANCELSRNPAVMRNRDHLASALMSLEKLAHLSEITNLMRDGAS